MPVATTTARLRTSLPSAAATTSSEPSGRKPQAGLPYTYSAPKLHACVKARRARSAPLTPDGKPRWLRISELVPAWPPIASGSITIVDKPSEAP